MAQFLRVVEVLTLHAILIDEFGGTDGVRDLGALEATVFRPLTGYYEDSIAEASALLESLIQNHPFLGELAKPVFTNNPKIDLSGSWPNAM